MSDRLERWLRRLPLAALSDVVAKRPSEGANLDVLDGVRGLAVLIVLLSHCGALHLHGHGAVGVWLFFALSAFLLTMPFARQPERVRDPAHLRHYAERRIRRIVPVYYAVIVFTFFSDSRVGLSFLVQHLAFVRADGIFWTIPQEVLFYAVLPVAVAIHAVLLRGRPGAAVVALALVACGANLYLDASVFSLNGNGKRLPFYLGIFATGMAFSYAYHWPALSRWVRRPALNVTLGWVGLLLLALLFLSAQHYHHAVLDHLPLVGPAFDALHPRMGLYYRGSFGVLCGLLVYLALVCEGRLLQRVLAALPLRALGIVSYSVYLLHMIVRDRIIALGVPEGNALFLWTLAVTYALACVLYQLVERPFMRVRTSEETA